MKYLEYLKKLTIFDYIIGVLFIVINVLSIILFKWLGLIALPSLIILIFIYYNSNKIAIMCRNLFRNIKKKDKKRKKLKINKKDSINIKDKFKKKKKNSLDDEFSYDDIIIKNDDEVIGDKIELVNEARDVDNVKKVNKKKNKKKKNTKIKRVKKSEDKKRKKFVVLKVLLSLFLIFCITGVLAVSAFITYIVVTTEDFDPNKLTYQDQTIVYDKDGNVFATLGTEKRESVTYNKLPQVLVDAIIATEDSRFFQHNGVDFARFLKASVGQLLGQSNAGGASTLTMQVSKNNLTSRDSDGIEGIIRKFRDVYISVFQIEKKYTKEEIIEFYVNDNLLGGSNYGVEQASQYYFGKSVSELNLAEAATIAGIFQSPNKYRPDLYPEAAETRRNLVLDLMVRHGYITKKEAEITKAISVESLMIVSNTDSEGYKGFLNTVVAEVEDKTKLNPYTVSMKIYTTLDPSIQEGIDKIMSGETYTWQNDVVQAGIAVIDVDTGEIVGIGAGRNQENKRGWNYATQSRKHPGSTAKPLFDYGPGFEYNNYSTYTLFNDEPWTYTNGPSVNNWNGTFDGLMTLRTALSQSRNIPALKAFQQNSKNNIQNFVNSLGITTESPLHEAHSIGGFTGATPLEMAAAYATFANGGYYIEPHTVTKIEYRDTGEVEEFKYTKERVMESSTAFMINNVLQYAVETGYDGGSRVYGKTVAAKTGTSSYDLDTIKNNNLSWDAVNDLWTVAYTPEYSFSLWYGYDEIMTEYHNTNSTGGSYKNALMRALVKVVPMTTKSFEIPDTVVKSEVEFGTWPAQLPSENTPSELIVTEYFKKGTQPTEVSTRFKKFDNVENVKVDKTSSKTIEISWDYKWDEEFTETYLKKYFSQSVFGNGTDIFFNQRIASYGGVGFGIYVEDSEGNVKQVGFTTEKEYKYTHTSIYNNVVAVIIKAQYKDYDINASDGVKYMIKLSSNNNNDNENSSDDNKNESSLITATIGKSASYTVENYKEKDFTVKYNNRTITDTENLTIYYKITSEDISTTDKNEFVDRVNSLEAGNYIIEYTIYYKDEIANFQKKLTLIPRLH